MLYKKRSLCLSINPIEEPDLQLFYSKKPNECFFCHSLHNVISKYKGFIDKIDNSKKWDYAKKISNPFELINQVGYRSISSIIPISRSYFKLLEIIADFNIIDNNNRSLTYAAIAEGPGGFVECFIRYRKQNFLGRNDQILCMTLKSDSNEIPNWHKAGHLFKNNSVKICYGQDGTGNLYNPDNIKNFSNKLVNKADLVTADGGFDYSTDFNKQEQMSSKLIFSEIICALAVNKKGGHFIIKVFDLYTIITVKLLYLLNIYYDKIIITKPFTSRPANSEKYIICKGFRGISDKKLENLYKMLSEWNSEESKGNYISDISGLKFQNSYLYELYKINKYLAKYQMINILKTIVFINYDIQPKDIIYLKKIQTVFALEWCKKYNNPINYNCMYLR